MCGRYFIDDEMWREIRKICKQIDDAKLKVTVGDVRPTDMAMVLTGMKNVHLEAMRWGFTSKYQDWLLINARAESILSKPAFRNSVRNCRCVIPAAGFYEWNKEKEKISFTMPQSDILYMAGVWQPTEKESQFTIITTVPNSPSADVCEKWKIVHTGCVLFINDKMMSDRGQSVPENRLHKKIFRAEKLSDLLTLSPGIKV